MLVDLPSYIKHRYAVTNECSNILKVMKKQRENVGYTFSYFIVVYFVPVSIAHRQAT